MRFEIRAGLVVLAVLILGAAVRADRNLSLESPGEPLSAIVKRLSAETGERLAVSPAVENEVLVLRVENVSTDDLLERIADTADATWELHHGTRTLTRTVEQERAERAAEHTADVAAIQRALDDLGASLTRQGAFDSSSATALANRIAAAPSALTNPGGANDSVAQRSSLLAQTPIGRGESRLTLTLSAEDLADLPLGIRVVYSNDPTRLQRRLPDAAGDVLEQIMAEQALWSEAASALGDNGPGRPSPLRRWMGPLAGSVQPFVVKPNRILLSVSRQVRGGAFQTDLTLIGPKGENLGQFHSGVAPAPVPQSKEANSDNRLLQLPDEVLLCLKSWSNTIEPLLPPALRARLLHPAKSDPLSLTVGSALVAAAKATDENLVALVSDRFSQIWGRYGSKTTVSSFLDLVRSVGWITEAKGWLEVRPLTPAGDRDEAADRTKLSEYLQQIDRQKTLSIEQAARWSIELPSPAENPVPRLAVSTLFGRARWQSQDQNLLRFYGGLSDAQRAEAQSEKGLALNGLSEVSQDALNHIIFGSSSRATTLHRFPHPVETNVDSGPPEVPMPAGADEPTEYLAGGLSNEARVVIAQTKYVAVQPLDGIQRGILDSKQLASALTLTINPGVHSIGISNPVPTSFLAGNARSLAFQFDLLPMISLKGLRLSEIMVSGDALNYADLPSDFRAEVEKQMDVLRQQFSRLETQLHGTGAPPPG